MSIKYVLLFLTFVTIAVPAGAGLLNGSQTTAASATTQTLPQLDGTVVPGAFDQTRVINTENTQTTTTISALGNIEANQIAEVSFLDTGAVAEVLVEPGDTVNAGDLLAWLDGATAQTAYDQARLNLERAQINLEELYEPPTESELRVADANIASAQAAYSSAANATSTADLEAAQLRYQQALNSYNAEVAARANMNGTEEQIALQDASVGAASFNLEIARLQLQELQNPDSSSLWSAGVKIKQAQLQKEELLAGPTQAEIDSAEIAVQRAEAQLAEAEEALRKTRLYAPISGVVTTVNVEPGDSVSTETIAVEISDLSQLWLVALVHEVDVDHVKPGMSAIVTLDALPDTEIEATLDRISWLSTVEDDVVNYETHFALVTDDPRVRVGMTAQAVVEVAS